MTARTINNQPKPSVISFQHQITPNQITLLNEPAPLPSTHDVLQSEFVTSRLPLEPHSRSTQQSTSLHRPTSPPVNGQLCVTTKTCPLLQTLLFQPCSFSCHSSVNAGAIVQLIQVQHPGCFLHLAFSLIANTPTTMPCVTKIASCSNIISFQQSFALLQLTPSWLAC